MNLPRGYHFDAPRPGLVPSGEPGLVGASWTGPGPRPEAGPDHCGGVRGQVDHDGDVLVAPPGVAPHRGGTSRTGAKRAGESDLHTIEAVRVAGDGLLSPGQDCVVGGVPGDPQGGCHPADRHTLQGKCPQPPLHRRVGQPRPGLSQAGGVLSPHPAAVGAGEAPQAHHQLRGPPPHRHVGQTPGHRPTSLPLRPAGSAERVLKPDRHAALDHRALRREVLAHHGQPQGIQPQEGRQIRAGEGSLRHVEVSRDGCVGTPIIEGPRPLPTATTHPPPPTHFNRPRLLHPQTRRAR